MGDDLLQAAVLKYVTEAIRNIRVFGLSIDGVEVTQSIQYRAAPQHLTDPADRGPDNSVRLVADKAAIVRVYVRHTPASVSGVTATVTLQRKRLGVWGDSGKLEQLAPSSIIAEPDPNYATERGDLRNSLNFLIPALTMRGQFRLRVEVNSPSTSQTVSDEIYVDASLLQTLKIRGIPIRYVGPDASGNALDLAAPTLAQFQATAATTLAMFPVSRTPDISLAGVFTWNQPLLGAIVGGQCPTSWNNLLFWLGVARVIDGNRTDSLYYGMFDPGIPTGGAAGCGGGSAGVGAGATNDGMTMVHEFGHVLGFAHAPCNLGTGDMGDPNYPAYEPYDTVQNKSASIGEYGCDVSTQTIYSPAFAFDFMSYCGPRWMSLYHTAQLVYHNKFNPRIVSGGGERSHFGEEFRPPSVFDRPDPPPPWVGRQVHILREPDPVRLIAVSGLLHSDRIEILSVMRLETGPTTNGERIDGAVVELLDANAGVLQRVALRRLVTQACGCGCGGGKGEPPTGLVQALLPDSDAGFTLRVVVNDSEIWSRQAPAQPPVISEVSAVVDNCELYVRWQTSASDAYPLERAVRWSSDGKHWQVLAIKLEEDLAVVSTRGLPNGRILVQVLVSDGFHGTTSGPVEVEISRCTPTAAILWPASGAIVRTEDRLHLWGVGTASDGSTIEPEEMQWYLDGQRVGTGPEVWTSLPPFDGEHEAKLRVRDGDLSATASVFFGSNCNGQQPYRLSRQE